MNPVTGLVCILLFILLMLLFPYEPADRKKAELLRSIKINRTLNPFEKAVQVIDGTFYDLLHFDKKDSASKLMKELIYSVVIGLAVTVAGTLFKMPWIGLGVGVSMLSLPFLIRWLNRKESRTLYQESFYRLINYIVLYLSGGLNILKSLEETEHIIPKDDIIRENFMLVLKERRISGISGDNVINSLEALNRDYHLEEIDQFIVSMNLANKKGISIVEILKSQAGYIRKKQSLRIQEKIASTDSKITLLKTLFGIGTAMTIFILPPIITAIISFGGTV